MTKSRLLKLYDAASRYGERSFDNYAQIRSIAEQIRDGFCNWLNHDQPCVFLVPPQGPFSAQNYRSAAFSVSGQGVLPLEPISFGLAINISEDGDYMRLVISASKEGDTMYLSLENLKPYEIELPTTDKGLENLYETLYGFLLHWFDDRVEEYDDGEYGSNDIGFDIQRVSEETKPA